MKEALAKVTQTGGREATTRHILGEMALSVALPSAQPPVGWKWTKLTDLARLESGHTPSRNHPEYWKGDVPWLGLRDARAYHGREILDTLQHTNELGIANSSARVLPKHTVCLSRTASVGYVVVMGRPMATSQDFVNWVCSRELDHNFLKYILLSESETLLRFASGATHQTIYFPEVKAFHICHPPVHRQQRIIGILDEALDGIAAAKANAEKNLQNARALFESYLQTIKGKKATLGELVKITTGKLDSNAAVLGGQYPFFTCSREVYAINTYAFNCEAILLAGNNAVGDFNVKHYDGKFNAYQRTYVITVHERQRLLYRFLYFQMLKSLKNFKALAVGAGTKFLKLDMIKNMEVCLPSATEQQSIVSKLDSILEAVERLESIYQQKLTALDALKKSLLHQAFTGAL